MLGPMKWSPKDWRWPPRLAKAFAKGFDRLRRTAPGAPAIALNALRNLDRQDLRRLWARAKSYVSSYYFTVLVLIALVLAWPWYDLLTTVRESLLTLLAKGPAPGEGGIPDIRGHYFAIGILVTALAALFTAPLTLLKAYINERQTTAAEQGLITDRFTRAVEQLGAEKTIKRREFRQKFDVDAKGKRQKLPDGTQKLKTHSDGTAIGDWEEIEETLPNLEVRLGAIYALERIAQDSERDHIPIMETLCAYQIFPEQKSANM